MQNQIEIGMYFKYLNINESLKSCKKCPTLKCEHWCRTNDCNAVISVVKEQAYSSLLGLSSVGSKAPDCIQWWYVSGWLLHIGSINDKVKQTY